MNLKKIKKKIAKHKTEAAVIGIGGSIIVFLLIKMFIQLLPIIGIGLVALIGYKLYKRGFFG